jgi:hypothetical protein
MNDKLDILDISDIPDIYTYAESNRINKINENKKGEIIYGGQNLTYKFFYVEIYERCMIYIKTHYKSRIINHVL